MAQLENIEAIEKRLWKSADTLRANSELASNEYFLPVMGLIFLRHAYSRYLSVKDDIVATLPSRGGKTRALTKEDFSKKSAIYLKTEAQFDYLIALKDADNRAEAIIHAMESIEADYSNLRNQLPKQEYNNIAGRFLDRPKKWLEDQGIDTAKMILICTGDPDKIPSYESLINTLQPIRIVIYEDSKLHLSQCQEVCQKYNIDLEMFLVEEEKNGHRIVFSLNS